jgi:anaerobic selenocysteine-containing dehydrogenase
MGDAATTRRIPGYCALCRSRCGCISVVRDGRLVAVEPDPSHPTGRALCAKGRAAPELVESPHRLLRPLKRTRPKPDPDPGWATIGWDEALDLAASRLRALADRHGPETVAFAVTTPSGTAISDAIQWIERLIHTFGSPNNCYATEICNWHKDHATQFTFGVGVQAPEFERTGCVLYWGHNPSTSWLTHATGALAARARGARLIVVDPRRAGLAVKADLWLRVRPGSDGALALGIAGVMLDEGWFDRAFVRDFTNGPLLVRDDTGRFLTGRDLAPGGPPETLVAWDERAGHSMLYDPATRTWGTPGAVPALHGRYRIPTAGGEVDCRPAFDRYAALCRQYPPDVVERITWVPARDVRAAAQLLWEARPVSYYAWTGVGQHTNATQTDRAIALLYALTGSFDAPGGNVIFARVPRHEVGGVDLLGPGQLEKALGRETLPLGPPRGGWVTSDHLYRAILEGQPYRVRGLVGFGANLVVSHADARRAREALRALEFTVYADLFMTPTAALADLVLPVSTAWEREGLRIGFEVSQEAESLVQLRPSVVAPRGESRSDTWIVFELARRLGLGPRFWNGDVDAGLRHVLAPSGISLEELRRSPGGVRAPLATRYRKYAAPEPGSPPGFATPTGKVEIYSERLLAHGYDPLPGYVEPAVGPGVAALAERYPLVLTSAKIPEYCHGQYRGIPALRRRVPHPEAELHPATAAARGIRDGDWVVVETPDGRLRARARLREDLDPRVVATQHGWWQACPELGLPGYDPYGPEGANLNQAIADRATDPISGSVPHRSYLCQVSRAEVCAALPAAERPDMETQNQS